MTRMFDKALSDPFNVPIWLKKSLTAEEWRPVQETMHSEMRNAAVIVADNVAEYFYAGTDQEEWDVMRDFPCLAPPFSNFWIEHQMPSQLVSRVTGTHILSREVRQTHVGIWFKAEDAEAIGKEMGSPAPAGARWFVQAYSFYDGPGTRGVLGPIGVWQCLIDGQGQLMTNPFFGTFVGRHPEMAKDVIPNADQIGHWNASIFPAFLAISFMHCKNVHLVTETPTPKLARAYQRRKHAIMHRYYTLDILPMKEILRKEGHSEQTGLRRALHICRGHFKDYTQSGLFGKIKGIFWWDSQLRGHVAEGIDVKDYNVKAPVLTGG